MLYDVWCHQEKLSPSCRSSQCSGVLSCADRGGTEVQGTLEPCRQTPTHTLLASKPGFRLKRSTVHGRTCRLAHARSVMRAISQVHSSSSFIDYHHCHQGMDASRCSIPRVLQQVSDHAHWQSWRKTSCSCRRSKGTCHDISG